jgi:ATP-dependent DNA helicase RecG
LEPLYREYAGGVEITFFNSKKVPEKVPENQRKILAAMAQDRYITIPLLAEILHISQRKTRENIAKLKAKSLIRRVGPDKGGHWEVMKTI